MTAWRRLRDWQAQGVWQHLMEYFLDELSASGRLAAGRIVVDSSLVPAKRGANIPDPTLATALNQEANIILSPMRMESRWLLH